MRYGFKDVVVDSRTGLNPRKNFVLGNGENNYITIKDIYNGQVNLTDKTDKVNDDAIQLIKKRSRIKVGDILFVSIGRIGETAIVTSKDDTWDVNESVFVFTINRDIITPEYFCTLFQSNAVQKYLAGNSSGSTFKSIKMNQLERMEFDLPSLEVQEKITAKLSKTKAICNLRSSELSLLDDLIKARFVEMFGNEQCKMRLSEVCSIITDGTHQPPQFVSDGIPFIFVSNITGNNITYDAEKFIDQSTYDELIKRTPIEIGDVLLSTVGSYGHPAVVKSNKKFLFQRHIAYLKPKKALVDSDYLHGAILSPDAQRQIEEGVKGIAQKTLNLSEIKKMTISVPELCKQKMFAAFVAQIDKSKYAIQKSLEETKLLFDSLMQEYFG